MNHHLVTGTLHSIAEILPITIVYLLRDSRLVIVINTLILIVCSGITYQNIIPVDCH